MKQQLITSILLMGTSAAVLAAPPHLPSVYTGGNLWTITAYDDASPAHAQWATQGICFLPPAVTGTHERGYWYSVTFPDWNGIYSQEGDQLFMHGDYAKDVGHDGMNINIDTARTAGGHWHEWRENGAFGNTIGFVNATMQRVGSCKSISATQLSALNIPPRYLLDGKEAQLPAEPNQRPV
ncbi:MAG: hypothetical protein U1B30_05655, partial [Pseudomonadota bacterium]|nr:hypothetical protein [Pseudomonadota bacterium]